jgi:cbb3-type cytochrome oxidase subunit 1
MPFWHLRTISGVAIISGVLLQAYNMWMTASHASAAAEDPAAPEVATVAS